MPIETGEISQRHHVEWTIKNIFFYTTHFLVGECLWSPKFFTAGSEWYIELFPNGVLNKEFMELCLIAERSIRWEYTFCHFGIKKLDGTVETLGSGFDKPYGLKKNVLLERKSELAPSGSLTITCSIKLDDGRLETASGLFPYDWPCSTDSCSWKQFGEMMDQKRERGLLTGLEKLSEDLKNMFQSRKGCDATLKAKDKEFPINRSILAARSPVFEAMFEADMQEKKTGVVDIVDCHPGAFNDFLVYIYSGKFEYTSGKIFELYTIAHKYDVELLKSECVAFMMENMRAENVVDAYAVGHRYGEKELKEESQAFFNKNFAEVFCNDKWELLYREKPIFVNMLLKGLGEYTLMKKKDEK